MTKESAMQSANRYISEGNRDVKGWCDGVDMRLARDISRLQQDAGVTGHSAEIGVHHGKLFILLALLTGADERSVAVDVFAEQSQNTDQSGQGDESIFLGNMGRHAPERPTPEILRTDSLKIGGTDIEAAAGGKVRLFSVDGGHTPECAEHDMQTAQDCLINGGVILLDDYSNARWPGVCEGTNRFMAGAGARPVPFAITNSKAYFASDAESAKGYLDGLQKMGFETEHALTQMFGQPVVYVAGKRLTLARRIGTSPGWRRFRETPLGAAIRGLVNAVTGSGNRAG